MKNFNTISRFIAISGAFAYLLASGGLQSASAATEVDPAQKEQDLKVMGIYASCAGFYEVGINMDLIPSGPAEENQKIFINALENMGKPYMDKAEYENFYAEQVTARANIVAALVVNNREKVVPKIEQNLAICEEKYLEDAKTR